MKIELEVEWEKFDDLMVERLKDYMEMNDPGKVHTEEDRKFCINMQKHLRAVINYMSPPDERI